MNLWTTVFGRMTLPTFYPIYPSVIGKALEINGFKVNWELKDGILVPLNLKVETESGLVADALKMLANEEYTHEYCEFIFSPSWKITLNNKYVYEASPGVPRSIPIIPPKPYSIEEMLQTKVTYNNTSREMEVLIDGFLKSYEESGLTPYIKFWLETVAAIFDCNILCSYSESDRGIIFEYYSHKTGENTNNSKIIARYFRYMNNWMKLTSENLNPSEGMKVQDCKQWQYYVVERLKEDGDL